jgi:hypothetical protein
LSPATVVWFQVKEPEEVVAEETFRTEKVFTLTGVGVTGTLVEVAELVN